jgi:hypothetical protein
MLPNLIIIGAGKSGTSSLYEYLHLHPDVGMSARKELQFFGRKDWRTRIDWYEAQFPEAPVRGEASPAYTMFPFQPDVAPRMQDLIPGARLIYLVRDPIARAVAHYVEYAALGRERRSIDEALSDVADPSNPYLCTSRYATQLGRFLRCFDAQQILVVDHDDLLNRRGPTLKRVFSFLEVDPTFESAEFERVHNIRSAKVRYRPLAIWMIKRGIFTRGTPGRSGRRLINPLEPLLSKPIDIVLSEPTRTLLTEALAPEVRRLQELTRRTFPHWLSFSP